MARVMEGILVIEWGNSLWSQSTATRLPSRCSTVLPVSSIPAFCASTKPMPQQFGTRQALLAFFRRILCGDSLLGTEGNDADVPLPLFLGDEPRESADRIFADDIGCSTVVLCCAAPP